MEKKNRDEILTGKTFKYLTGCGNIYITINNNSKDEPIELFANLGKAGECKKCILEGISRLISLGLKYDVPLNDIIDEINNLACDRQVYYKGERIKSCIDAIAKALKENSKKEASNDK